MNYKIVTFGNTKVFSLAEISRNLKVQSEVYALSDKEIYLGLISHKTLVFFATEFAEYAIKNYTRDRVPEADLCISLIRKWISGDTSLSKRLSYAANAAAAITSYSGEAATSYSAEAASYAIYSANAAANAANTNSGSAAADANVNAVYAAYYASDTAGKDKDKEFIRQGEFILDFLKSGKNLFLV